MKKKTTHFWVYLFAICCDFYLFRLFNDCLIYKLGSPQKLLYTFQVYYIFEVLLWCLTSVRFGFGKSDIVRLKGENSAILITDFSKSIYIHRSLLIFFTQFNYIYHDVIHNLEQCNIILYFSFQDVSSIFLAFPISF